VFVCAPQVVIELQAKLTKLQPVLAKAAADTEALLVELERDQKDADVAAGVAAKDEAETSQFARQVAVIKADCQRDLDEVCVAARVGRVHRVRSCCRVVRTPLLTVSWHVLCSRACVCTRVCTSLLCIHHVGCACA
jgi:hypothetical protein